MVATRRRGVLLGLVDCAGTNFWSAGRLSSGDGSSNKQWRPVSPFGEGEVNGAVAEEHDGEEVKRLEK